MHKKWEEKEIQSLPKRLLEGLRRPSLPCLYQGFAVCFSGRVERRRADESTPAGLRSGDALITDASSTACRSSLGLKRG